MEVLLTGVLQPQFGLIPATMMKLCEECFRDGRRLVTAVILSAATLLSGATLAQNTNRGERIILKVRPATVEWRIAAFHIDQGIKNISKLSAIHNLQVLELPTGVDAKAAVERYRQSGLVDYAEVDSPVRLAAEPNDPAYTNGGAWHLKNYGHNGGVAGADINAAAGWDLQFSASNVVVAVIDTGIRYTHEDLASNMWVNPSEIAGNGLDDDADGVVDDVYGFNAASNSGDPIDAAGHGTEVAGVIGAVGNNGLGTAGVAWNVKLMACRYTDASGNGYLSSILACFDYALRKHADIINASFESSGYSQAMKDAIAACRSNGVIVVAAAGNEGRDADVSPVYPAAYGLDNIVSVAATTSTDALASFSNFGLTNVQIAAPGMDVFTTIAGADSGYGTGSGTSFSAPIISGGLALLKAHYPQENYRQLLNRLYAGVDRLPGLGAKCATGGRLNLAKALGRNLVADFSADLTSGVAPLNVTFTDYSAGAITNWAWDFGDGTSSAEKSPVHTFRWDGDFRVTLRVTDDAGQFAGRSLSVQVVGNYQIVPAAYDWVPTNELSAIPIGCGPQRPALLPFTFNYYGLDYTNVYLGAYGMIGFDGLGFFNPNTDLPRPGAPNNIICPFWASDLDVCTAGSLYAGTVGATPHRKFVVCWSSVPDFFAPSALYTFELWLEEGSQGIQFQYQNVQPPASALSGGGTATIGLENSSGTVAARFSFNGSTPVTNGQAIRFLPPGAGSLTLSGETNLPLVFSGPRGGPFSPATAECVVSNSGSGPLHWAGAVSNGWLAVSAQEGWLLPNLSTNIALSVNGTAGTLGPGTYAGSIVFSDLKSSGSLSRTVELFVLPRESELAVLPDTTTQVQGQLQGPFRPDTASYVITNRGDTLLSWSVASSADWFTLSPTNGLLGPQSSSQLMIQVNSKAAALPSGTNFGLLTFANDSNALQTVTRQFNLAVYRSALDRPVVSGTNGALSITLRGVPGWEYVLETSTNLYDWDPIFTNTPSGLEAAFEFLQPATNSAGREFYRGRLLP